MLILQVFVSTGSHVFAESCEGHNARRTEQQEVVRASPKHSRPFVPNTPLLESVAALPQNPVMGQPVERGRAANKTQEVDPSIILRRLLLVGAALLTPLKLPRNVLRQPLGDFFHIAFVWGLGYRNLAVDSAEVLRRSDPRKNDWKNPALAVTPECERGSGFEPHVRQGRFSGHFLAAARLSPWSSSSLRRIASSRRSDEYRNKEVVFRQLVSELLREQLPALFSTRVVPVCWFESVRLQVLGETLGETKNLLIVDAPEANSWVIGSNQRVHPACAKGSNAVLGSLFLVHREVWAVDLTVATTVI